MPFVCQPCNASFALKTNLERHNTSSKHAKCIACVESPTQPKITEFFVTEEKFAEHQEVVLALSEKVASLETTTAALIEQVKSLVQANVQLAHDNKIMSLKIECALRPTPVVPPEFLAIMETQSAALVALQTKVNKPRNTGEENDQALINKWFKHKRTYPQTEKDGSLYKSGFNILSDKLLKHFKENTTFPVGDTGDRLLQIFKEELDDDADDNFVPWFDAACRLKSLKTLLKFSEEQCEWIEQVNSFDNVDARRSRRDVPEMGNVWKNKK